MNSKKAKIFLTGSHGMLGKNILEHSNSNLFEFLAPSKTELDLRNCSEVQEYINQHKPDLIIHAAGLVGGIQANLNNPVNFLIDNIDISRNVIGSAHRAGIKKLINVSSYTVYPRNYNGTLTEDMVLSGDLEPANEGYALAKAVALRHCEFIMREDSSYQYKTLVPCNLYGTHDRFDETRSHLIPALILRMYRAREENHSSVEIWGDGTARRELFYAGDLADIIITAIQDFNSLPALINVGEGQDHSMTEIYRMVAEIVGYQGEFTYNLNKPTGKTRRVLNINKLTEWGWTQKTNLREGIRHTYNYYLKEKI